MMNEIRLLDKDTIDKIAAGEVAERPASVVKELVENSIDSGARAISVEIKNGGTDLIRVTDNGSGIPKDQIKKAVLRHSTSKIKTADDLSGINTLGFRGEALASICAVSDLEIMTKTPGSVMGAIYKAEGGHEISLEDAALPEGTTVTARNLFHNVPARLKFLKSPRTEAGYVSEIIEKIALSHADISFKFINNGSVRLFTGGNGNLKDTLCSVFGREISSNVIPAGGSSGCISISGFIGKPEIARSSRILENYFINGRYIKDKIISKAVEDAYRGRRMKGSFPFCCLNISADPALVDVNVHPSKLAVKFSDPEAVYDGIYSIVSGIISGYENIPEFTIKETPAKNETPDLAPAGYEEKYGKAGENYKPGSRPDVSAGIIKDVPEPFETERAQRQGFFSDIKAPYGVSEKKDEFKQETIFENKFMEKEAVSQSRIVGQVFSTYWIVEYEDKMYIIDQHAAHEKVLYEKFIKEIESGRVLRQNIYPAIIVSLSASEENTFKTYREYFARAGFEAECFGGPEYLISAVPATLYSSMDYRRLFLDILEELKMPSAHLKPESASDRVAQAACKAAVKGGSALSRAEAQALIDSLLSLENPYNCPHGRPTIISMSKYELEKKFKRII